MLFEMFGKLCIYSVLVVLVYVTYTVQQGSDPNLLTKIVTASTDCASQYNFTTDYVYGLWNLSQFPDDKNLKCFFSCVSLKLGITDASGNVDDTVLQNVAAVFFNVTLTTEIGKVCDIAKEGNACQTAFDVMQCLLDIINGKPQ